MDLSTERLRLRRWTDADLDALHRIWSDPKTIWWGHCETLERTRTILQKIHEQHDWWWAVEREGEIIGDVFLRPSQYHEGVLELGYHFVSTSWGHGYATEAVRAVLSTRAGKPVEATIVPENERSRSVARKLGFTTNRQIMHSGRLHDLWVLTTA